eukprot:2013621-Alexandrium_andersonii.AAC.1
MGRRARASGCPTSGPPIEVLAAKQALATNGIGVRWVHSHAQVADGCTSPPRSRSTCSTPICWRRAG